MPEPPPQSRDEIEPDWVRIPDEPSSPQGWPVLLFLHGCGERGSSYVVHAQAAANHGFAGIAVSGPLPTRNGGYSWPGGLAATHDHLEALLSRLSGRVPLDRRRVFLCGFSQGATHDAYGLLLSHPQNYRGAIVLSPGEGPPPPAIEKAGTAARPLYLAHGQKEYRAFRQRARKWAALWRRRGWPCWLEAHAGGHHFPADWGSRFPAVLGWLGDQVRDQEAVQSG
jgi:predicted esterase